MSNKKRASVPKVAPTWQRLADLLSVNVSTLYRARQKPKAPKTRHVERWRKFLAALDLATPTLQPQTGVGMPAGLDLGKLKLQLLEARTGRERAERTLKEMRVERESDDYVLTSDAVGAINRVLEPLAKLVDGLPKAWAVRVNPGDPDHAEPVLREMVETLKENLQSGRGEKITKRKGVK